MKWYAWAGIAVLIVVLNRQRVVGNLKNRKLSENFNLSEFVVTRTGFENIPGPKEIENLELLAINILQPLRTHLGRAVIINSAYRSALVNAKVGGVMSSQHLTGQAADIHVPGMTNQQVIDAIRKLKLPYDQLIDEQVDGDKWVHVSFVKNGGRRAWLTARDGANGKTVYTTIEQLAA